MSLSDAARAGGGRPDTNEGASSPTAVSGLDATAAALRGRGPHTIGRVVSSPRDFDFMLGKIEREDGSNVLVLI